MDQQLSTVRNVQVVPFPLRARTAAIRHAVEALTVRRVTDEVATKRWVRVTQALADELHKLGFDPIVVATELCLFEDAVRAELRRLGRFADAIE